MLIQSGTLVCMDDAGTVVRGDLLIRDGVIVALGDVALALGDRDTDVTRIDSSGALVLPGFVQGHLHLCQTLFRGLAEQHDLLRWLSEAIWPLEAAHSAASIAASVRLGVCELLAAGVTCVNDMGSVRHTAALGEALEASGIRAQFGKALMDRGDVVPGVLREPADAALAEVLALKRRFHGAGAGRLAVTLAPRFILSCSDALWDGVAATAHAHDLLVHTHLSESAAEVRAVAALAAGSATGYFERRGVLSKRLVAAHGVWLDAGELATLARADAALVHCPGSNLKLGSGIADVAAWRDAGLRRGIGSDGAACNNRLDPFHEMGLAASLSRVRSASTPLGARDVLALATCDGARALGLGDRIGSLEPGKQADVVVVDTRAPHHGPDPLADPYVTLVHGARASDVRMTMVAGRVLYRDGRWSTLDPDQVRREALGERNGLLKRAGFKAAA